jgi:hypothetical protein
VSLSTSLLLGSVLGYSGDDIAKFLWMVRIAGSVDPTVKEKDYLSPQGAYVVSDQAPRKFLRSLMYKLCYYRWSSIQFGQCMFPHDRLRHHQHHTHTPTNNAQANSTNAHHFCMLSELLPRGFFLTAHRNHDHDRHARILCRAREGHGSCPLRCDRGQEHPSHVLRGGVHQRELAGSHLPRGASGRPSPLGTFIQACSSGLHQPASQGSPTPNTTEGHLDRPRVSPTIIASFC